MTDEIFHLSNAIKGKYPVYFVLRKLLQVLRQMGRKSQVNMKVYMLVILHNHCNIFNRNLMQCRLTEHLKNMSI
jgi:hypothetical protein